MQRRGDEENLRKLVKPLGVSLDYVLHSVLSCERTLLTRVVVRFSKREER